MSAPQVSVVIPTYRGGKSLRAALSALTAQDLRGFEVVVVDDGSPDPVTADAASVTDVFELRIIRQQNAGPAAARNLGAQQARGEILAFTDDDCLPRPDWLSTLTRELSLHPESLVGSLTFNGLPDNRWSASSQLIIDLVYAYFNCAPENQRIDGSSKFHSKTESHLRFHRKCSATSAQKASGWLLAIAHASR